MGVIITIDLVVITIVIDTMDVVIVTVTDIVADIITVVITTIMMITIMKDTPLKLLFVDYGTQRLVEFS